MKKLLSFFLLSSCFIIFSCDTGTRTEEDTDTTAVEDQNQRVEDDTREFVKTALCSGSMEVQAGKIAQEKAQNQQVKDFAQQLMNEHQSVTDKLKNIAQQNNINIPQEMKDWYKEKVEELKNTPKEEFDKKYIDIIVNVHEKDINEFENIQDDIQNQEIKNWTTETLPKLRNHLDEAKRIKENLENKNQ